MQTSDQPEIYSFIMAIVRFVVWFPWLHLIWYTKNSLINSHFYILSLLNSLFMVSSIYAALKFAYRRKTKEQLGS